MFRRLRPTLPLLAFFLSLTACEFAEPAQCVAPSVGIERLPDSELSLIPDGDVVRLSVRGPQFSGCVPPSLVPDTVRVEVSDALNHVLPSRSALHPGLVASVEFVSSGPGVYHVVAFFEPGGHLMQRNVRVGADRAGAPDVVLPAACLRLSRTRAGAWLCDGRVFRADTEVQQLEGLVSVDGNRVWQVGADSLKLLEDTGAGPLEERARVDWTGGAQAVAPTLNGVVLLSGERLVPHVIQPDGSLWSPGDAEVSTSAPAGELLVDGETVHVLASMTPTGTRATAAGFEVCPFTLRPDGPPAPLAPCRRLDGELQVPEGTGVWVRELLWTPDASATPRGIIHYRFDGTVSHEARLSVLPALPLVLPGGRSGAGNVQWTDGWLVPLVVDGVILAERYLIAGAKSANASATLVWARIEGDRTAVWTR